MFSCIIIVAKYGPKVEKKDKMRMISGKSAVKELAICVFLILDIWSRTPQSTVTRYVICTGTEKNSDRDRNARCEFSDQPRPLVAS